MTARTSSGGSCIFGGAFDPPHLGHRDVLKALQALSPQVWVVVDDHSRLKKNVAPLDHRLEMTRVLLSSTASVAHEKTAFDLIRRLSPSAFAIGSDQLESLPRWHRFPEILDLCDWWVWTRAPHTRQDTLDLIQKIVPPAQRHRFRVVSTEARDISSTQIRETLARQDLSPEQIERWLSPLTWEYLKRNHLYGT